MKKNLLLIMLMTNAVFSQTTTFTIIGRIEGLQDSTKLFLRDNKAEKTIASAYVMNERFQIKGSYPTKDAFLYVMLHNKDFSKFKNFWIEKDKIEFQAAKGNFSDAKITGSSLQLLADQLQKSTNPHYDSIRMLTKNLINKSGPDSLAIQNSISSIERKIDQIQVEYIRKHPNSIFSASLLSVISKKIPVTKTKELYGLLPTYLQNSNYGKLVKKVIDFKKEIKVGEHFIDFEQRDSNGKMVRLSDVKFEYLLLEFWFSNCGPCIRENPKLVELYKKFNPKGFEIVAVSVDKSEKIWLDAIKRGGLPWINVCELTGTDNTAAITYGIYEYPTNFLINKEGKIIAKNVRGEDLQSKLMELFKI
nr:TlpA disulfide reductase family protein [uncultured Flavobacterium sp.]